MKADSDELVPWEISALHFPGHDAPIQARLGFLVGYAILAPSGYNRQPWLFKIRGGRLEVHADRRRALPVIDHNDREMTISCGAAIFNLRVAARHFGYMPLVEILPEEDHPDLLATFTLGDRRPSTHEENVLFGAITRRRTNRAPFEKRKVDPAVLQRMCKGARDRGAWMVTLVHRAEKHKLADLIAEGDRIQFADKRFRRELAAWVHSNRSHSHDGMPAMALGMSEVLTAAHSLPIRTFDIGKGVAAKDQDLAEHSPALAVIGTAEDTPRDWIRAGQALQDALLIATSLGVSASFMNQAVEVELLRPRVATVVERTGFAQVVFRLGYGPELPRMPRRSVSEVLRTD